MRIANYSGTVAIPVGGFLNAAGTLTDPTTTTLYVQDPTGAVTQPSTTRDATGLFHADIDTTGKAGVWTYEWKGVGAVQAIAVNQFRTTPAPI